MVYTGTGGSGVGLRPRMELHNLITKSPFIRKVFQICAGGINLRVNIRSLYASNSPNILAPTLNVVKEDFSVLIDFMFMFQTAYSED